MANLTPEQLARLRQMVQQGGQAEYYDEASGRSFMPTYGDGRYEGENYIPGEITGFRGYEWAPGMFSDNYELNGTQYDQFDASGNQTGQGTWEGLKKNSAMDTLLPLAMVAAPFALSMFPGLGAAASFGSNPVLSGASTSGFAPGAAAGAGLGTGSGAFVGEAPWTATGGGPLQFGSTPSSGGFFNSLGNGIRSIGNSISDGVSNLFSPGAGSVANPGGSEYFLGEGMASGVPAWDAAATKAGLSLVAPAVAGTNKALGLLSTVAGAAMGAQGKKEEKNLTERMDPRMDALFYGDLAPRAQGLLDKQMAPGYLQGFDDMRAVGQNLLNTPVAGNGFNRFFPGR